jgi:RNA polymerase sigma-70 factor (ECF subfamily)
MVSASIDDLSMLDSDTGPSEPEQCSDEQLLLEYRETGAADRFETLVHRYERELFNYLRRYLANAEMAEDAFQGTFLQVHLKSDQFQRGRRVRPWLYTIATNQAIDAQRRNKRHQLVSLDRTGGETEDVGTLIDLLISGEPDPHEETDTEEQREALRKALRELPESFRQVVMLVYYQGLKYREAAEVLSIPVGTVKSRLHSALTKLTEALRSTHTD